MTVMMCEKPALQDQTRGTRDGGSADSELVSSSRTRLSPPSDTRASLFVEWIARENPERIDMVYPPGYPCKDSSAI